MKAQTRVLHVDGGNIPFVKKFSAQWYRVSCTEYLGSVVPSDLKDDLEVDA
jgi:hypothetical protein